MSVFSGNYPIRKKLPLEHRAAARYFLQALPMSALRGACR
jgi:hypothetical protein